AVDPPHRPDLRPPERCLQPRPHAADLVSVILPVSTPDHLHPGEARRYRSPRVIQSPAETDGAGVIDPRGVDAPPDQLLDPFIRSAGVVPRQFGEGRDRSPAEKKR